MFQPLGRLGDKWGVLVRNGGGGLRRTGGLVRNGSFRVPCFDGVRKQATGLEANNRLHPYLNLNVES